jgi:phosphatidylserine/phosphatidylglycerophosphate/cardiolipin synthase-like enzyme
MEQEQTIHIFGNEYPKKVIPLVREAKKNIEIIVYSWRWYYDDMASPVMIFNQAILEKANRGIPVRAITQDKSIIPILKKSKVRVLEKKIEKVIHAKLLLIDDRITILGSHNFTKRAFESNLELSNIHFDEAFTKNYKDFFENLWRN